MRSPFVPDTYALIGPLWLWSVMVAAVSLAPPSLATPEAGKNTGCCGGCCFSCRSFVLPVEGVPLPGPAGRVLLSLVPQAFALALVLRALWRPVELASATPAAGGEPA